MSEKLKIVLTGGNGFLATRFAHFYQENYNVILLGKRELDVRDENQVLQVLKHHSPQYVIHAAAIATTPVCEQNPELSYEVNVKGSINVAKACLEIGAKLMFLSTEQIFNAKKKRGPFQEDEPPECRTVYGKHKYEAETVLRKMMNDQLWIVRLSWLFGLPERNMGQMTSNILWTTMQSLIKDQKMVVNVHEYRGMTYVYDAIKVLQLILEKGSYGVYHLSSENNESRYEIVVWILTILGVEQSRIQRLVEKDEKTFTAEAPRDIRVDTTKLKTNLGVDLGTTKDGLLRCLREFNYI